MITTTCWKGVVGVGGIGVSVAVGEVVGLDVAVCRAVGVTEGVSVDGVRDGVGVRVLVGVVDVDEGVAVGSCVPVLVAELVGVVVAVGVIVAELVGVAVADGDDVNVAVLVAEFVGLLVAVGV